METVNTGDVARRVECSLKLVKPEVGFREGSKTNNQQPKGKKKHMNKPLLMAMGVALAGATSVNAGLNVAFDTVSPNLGIPLTVSGSVNENYGGVYAGIYILSVNGVTTPSLCIDVAQLSGTASDYSYQSLASSPTSAAGPMGTGAAKTISQLWYANFAAAESDATGATAAGLQLAVWETVALGNGHYTVSTTDTAVQSTATAMLTALQAPGQHPTASLRGLVSPTTQNYVVPVPEPTTMVAGLGGLGLALLGVFGSRRSGVIKIGQ